MYENLTIITWPDPRLKKNSPPVEKFDADLAALAKRMFELMREAKGVGLAAPQVGINTRLFVMNPTGKPEDDRTYVNPVLSEPIDEDEAEEGCLSLPGINVQVVRSKKVQLDAHDLDGKPVRVIDSGYIPRIWQHEIDHLNGILLIDRMGPVARLTNRKILKELEEKYEAANPKKRR